MRNINILLIIIIVVLLLKINNRTHEQFYVSQGYIPSTFNIKTIENISFDDCFKYCENDANCGSAEHANNLKICQLKHIKSPPIVRDHNFTNYVKDNDKFVYKTRLPY